MIRSLELVESQGLKTTADAVWSRMGLPTFTHSVEACELCLVGVNSGALGFRLEVVDSVAGGGTAAAPLAGSPRLVDPLQILVWCFP